MAEKTTELVEDVTKATEGVESALAESKEAYDLFANTMKLLDKLGAKFDADDAAQTLQGAVLQEGELRFALKGVDDAIATLEKATKELGSKVKLKSFLNLFKDQKSLKGAKDTLAAGLAAVKDGRKRRASLTTSADKLKERLTGHKDKIGSQVQYGAKVAAIHAWGTDTLRGQAGELSKLLLLLKGREKELATLRKKFEDRAEWDANVRDALIADVRDVEAAAGERGLQRSFANVQMSMRKSLSDLDIDNELRAPPIRAALDKYKGPRGKLEVAQSEGYDRSLALTQDAQDLIKDLGALNVGLGVPDGQHERAQNEMEVLRTTAVDAPTLEIFAGGLDKFRDWSPFLSRASKDPSKLSAEDWKEFEAIEDSLEVEESVAEATVRQMARVLRQAERLATRHPDVDGLADSLAEIREAIGRREKEYAAFKKALPVVKKAVARIGSFHP